MAGKNLHDKPFGESTIAKLLIFEDYAQAWIPTFIMQNTPTICIFDFFAGTGYDINGIAGSPIRILQKIKEQIDNIIQKRTKLIVHLNEFEPNKKEQKKFELLRKACAEYLNENIDVAEAIEIKYFNEDFENLFKKLLSVIKDFPSLVYLDQNGLKFLSDKYLLELEKMKQTDFLYFASASYLWRFGETSTEFKTHLHIDMNEVKSKPYKFVHRSFIEQLRKKMPSGTKLKLYPFSLKKEANIYGIIFGASHPLAVDKFLRIAWKRSPINGDANFDIDDDELKNQGLLFGNPPLKKIEEFQKKVREKVLAGEITNNYQLYEYALEQGHIGTHAADELKRMKKIGEVSFNGISPLVTYEKVYGKESQELEYNISKI